MNGAASAPASAGNIGPGFDCLALAFELRCVVAAEPAGRWTLVEDGETREAAEDELVVRAASAAGGPYRLTIRNEIPRTRGLGSSSAVTAAAAAAAFRAGGVEPGDDDLLRIVAELEGHIDNAAAAVFGGLVVGIGDRIRRLDVHPDLQFVAAIPETPLPTAVARQALSATVPRDVASRSIARSVMLIEGLRTADPDALAGAAGDELHEAPRAALSPITARLLDVAREAGALHTCWSGAGPTALAIVSADAAPRVAAACASVLGEGGEVRSLEVAAAGWR